MQQKFWHNKTSNTLGILEIQLLCTCTTNAGLTRVRLRECISENIDMQICPNTPIVTFGLSKFQFIYIYSNSLCIKINYFTFEVGFGYMGILYIRPLHFPNKEKSFCTKPIFLFKSNTMLQTNILDVDDLFCTLDTLVGVHVVAVMLQTKEPVLGTGKTDHSKNSNSSTQHSSTGKTRTLADTEQLDHRVFRLTPTVSIILRPTPSRKQVRVYR